MSDILDETIMQLRAYCYVLVPELYSEREDARQVLEEVYVQYSSPKKTSRDTEINY